MDIHIRNEKAGDAANIHQVTELAFRDAPHTDHTEQFIVDALRRSQALTISRVAELNGELIGHVAISPVRVSDGSVGWFGLGPISVLPEFQRLGIGSMLMRSALADLEATGASGCVVLGDPGYYGRFGFKVIKGLIFPDAPAECLQARSFRDHFPQGEVVYHASFEVK